MGQAGAGFDFTLHMRRLCDDMARRVSDLAHIDMGRVAVSFTQTRSATQYGIYATTTPLRFPGGKTHTVRRGQKWGLQRVVDPSGQEMLYLVSFYLPRFMNLDLRQKLITTAHELWHIGPQFDGDLRRFGGRCYAHSHSREKFDEQSERLVTAYLASQPAEASFAFLRGNFRDLHAAHGRIFGVKISAPKMFRMQEPGG